MAERPELVIEENVPFKADLDAADLHCLTRLLGGAWQIRNGSFVAAHVVGHVALPSGRVLRIRSRKAPIASVMAWSAYVDPSLGDLQILGELKTSAQEADVATLAARIFLSELTRAVAKHGLALRYQRILALSASVRGRIDFTRLAQRAGDASRVPCEIWERRPRSPGMQLLAATLARVALDPIMRVAAPALQAQLLRIFAEVPTAIDPLLQSGRSELDRNERGFSAAIVIARFILRSVGLAEGSETDGLSYLVGMDLLFERAVVRALAENGVLTQPKHSIPHERLRIDGTLTAGSSVMELDAYCPTLAAGGLVVDAKYKDSISSANLQQMLAYCALTGAREGVLAVPAGLVQDKDRRAYRFRPRVGFPVIIHVVEFDVHGATVAEWRASAKVFAERVRYACDRDGRLMLGSLK